jgi:hypothetical protein
MAAHKVPASLRPRCTWSGSSVAAILVYQSGLHKVAYLPQIFILFVFSSFLACCMANSSVLAADITDPGDWNCTLSFEYSITSLITPILVKIIHNYAWWWCLYSLCSTMALWVLRLVLFSWYRGIIGDSRTIFYCGIIGDDAYTLFLVPWHYWWWCWYPCHSIMALLMVLVDYEH